MFAKQKAENVRGQTTPSSEKGIPPKPRVQGPISASDFGLWTWDLGLAPYRGKRPRYSPDTRNAFTISASRKLPLKEFSFSNQKL